MQPAGRSRTKNEGTIIVPRHDVQVSLPSPHALNVARLAWNEETTLGRAPGGEAALAIPTEEHAVPRVHAADLRLHPIEVAREQYVERAIAIVVRGMNAVDGRRLRLDRQRYERERSATIVPHHHGRERASLLQDRARQLFARKNVGDRLRRVVLVGQISRLEVRKGLDQVVAQHDRIARSLHVARDDLLAVPVVVEILHVHRHGLGLAGAEPRIEAEVADDEVGATVAVEVAGHDAVPPSLALLEPGYVQLF